jgi:hypothetical protein
MAMLYGGSDEPGVRRVDEVVPGLYERAEQLLFDRSNLA